MYIIYGVAVWVLTLAVLGTALRLYPRFQSDVAAANEEVQELIDELSTPSIGMIAGMGGASAAIIGFWPVLLFFLILGILVFCLGGIPYLLVRKMKSPSNDDDEMPEWTVLDKDVNKNSTRK